MKALYISIRSLSQRHHERCTLHLTGKGIRCGPTQERGRAETAVTSGSAHRRALCDCWRQAGTASPPSICFHNYATITTIMLMLLLLLLGCLQLLLLHRRLPRCSAAATARTITQQAVWRPMAAERPHPSTSQVQQLSFASGPQGTCKRLLFVTCHVAATSSHALDLSTHGCTNWFFLCAVRQCGHAPTRGPESHSFRAASGTSAAIRLSL